MLGQLPLCPALKRVFPDLPASRTRGGEVDEPAVSGPTWHYIVGVTMRDRMKISTFRIDDIVWA
jgi:hypothetical protein